jgi:hypothetical protein
MDVQATVLTLHQVISRYFLPSFGNLSLSDVKLEAFAAIQSVYKFRQDFYAINEICRIFILHLHAFLVALSTYSACFQILNLRGRAEGTNLRCQHFSRCRTHSFNFKTYFPSSLPSIKYSVPCINNVFLNMKFTWFFKNVL